MATSVSKHPYRRQESARSGLREDTNIKTLFTRRTEVTDTLEMAKQTEV